MSCSKPVTPSTTAPSVAQKLPKKRGPRKVHPQYYPGPTDPCVLFSGAGMNAGFQCTAKIIEGELAPGPHEKGSEWNIRQHVKKAFLDQNGDTTFQCRLPGKDNKDKGKFLYMKGLDIDNTTVKRNRKRATSAAIKLFEGGATPQAANIYSALNKDAKGIPTYFNPSTLVKECMDRIEISHGQEPYRQNEDFDVTIKGYFYGGVTFIPREITVECPNLRPEGEAAMVPDGSCIFNKDNRGTSGAQHVSENHTSNMNVMLAALATVADAMHWAKQLGSKTQGWKTPNPYASDASDQSDIDTYHVVAGIHLSAPKLSPYWWKKFIDGINPLKMQALVTRIDKPVTAKMFLKAAGLMHENAEEHGYSTNIECAKQFTVPPDNGFHEQNVDGIATALLYADITKEFADEGDALLTDATAPEEHTAANSDVFPHLHELSEDVRKHVIAHMETLTKKKKLDGCGRKGVLGFLTALKNKAIPEDWPLNDTDTLPDFTDSNAWETLFKKLIFAFGLVAVNYNSNVKAFLTGTAAETVCKHLNAGFDPIDIFADPAMFRKIVYLIVHHMINERAVNEAKADQGKHINETLEDLGGPQKKRKVDLETLVFDPSEIEDMAANCHAANDENVFHSRYDLNNFDSQPKSDDGSADTLTESEFIATIEGGPATDTVNILPQLPVPNTTARRRAVHDDDE